MAPRTRITIKKGNQPGLSWQIDGVSYLPGQLMPNWGLTAAASSTLLRLNNDAAAPLSSPLKLRTGSAGAPNITCAWGGNAPHTFTWTTQGGVVISSAPGDPVTLTPEFFDSLITVNGSTPGNVLSGCSTLEIVHDDDSMPLPADWSGPAD